MLKLERVALAIVENEGWIPPREPDFPNGSKSWRNKNPGNLRASPYAIAEKDGMAVFKDDLMGWHALLWDLTQKCEGNTITGLKGDSTLAQLIKIWAPDADNNNSSAYAQNIELMTGIPLDTKLSTLLD